MSTGGTRRRGNTTDGGKPFDVELKIVMIGSVAVGKTSVMTRFVSGTFREFVNPTIGASYVWKREVIDGLDVKFSLWDTAGQEQFHAIVPMYFRDADGVILVTDLSRNSSRIQEEVSLWVDKIRCNAPPMTQILIVGNKSDLQGIDLSRKTVQEVARKHEFLFVEASAKTGVGVADAFHALASTIIRERRPTLLGSTRAGLSAAEHRPSDRHATVDTINLGKGKGEKTKCFRC